MSINDDEHISKATNGIKTITLSKEDNERLYSPWKYSLIVKLLGKRIADQYLKSKLQQVWKPSEYFPLIDLGVDYCIVKFTKEENMIHELNGRGSLMVTS